MFFSTFINVEVTKKSKKLFPISNQYTDNLRRLILICNKKLPIPKKKKKKKKKIKKKKFTLK